MASNPTDIWAWTRTDQKRLKEEGGAKAAILSGYNDFWYYFHSDFAAADRAITQALEAARATGELRWELHMRHWRLQLWLRDDLTRVLPEVVDLLTLATDERVRDVPQRICAYHDVVDCYVGMDAAGYHDEIVANSQDILAQLPQRHPCATCARMHIAQAAAAAGRAEEAETWMARGAGNLSDARYAGWLLGTAFTHELLSQWEDAERVYLEARELAQKNNESDDYLKATLGVARARVGRGNGQGAAAALRDARHTAKYTGGTYLLARMLEVEGYVAEAGGEPQIALDYLTRAARHYHGLGCYRDAALAGLHAAEMALAASLTDADAVLSITAQAVGMMPPASRDVYARLAALGRQPTAPADALTPDAASLPAERQTRAELAALEDALNAHITNGNPRGVALALYRLGRWHQAQEAYRAAVDYLIFNAVLERILMLPMEDREDALDRLKYLRDKLPAGAVTAALTAAEGGPPALLTPLLGGVPPERWRWLVRAITTEVGDTPMVEPEPEAANDEQGFDEWLAHTASMVALIVRFRDQADATRCEQWAATLDETAAEMAQQFPPADEGSQALLSLVRGLAALSRGTPIADVQNAVRPPFDQIIQQIGQLQEEPVWFHPGSSPIDFLVEQAAQKAVRALRLHDEHRARRLTNLAFRYDLMAIDLRQHEELQPIARFLDALSAYVLADGVALPHVAPPLEEPFAAVLAAVAEAGATSTPST